MCGILAVIGKKDVSEVQALSKRMLHRGPDESGIYIAPNGNILSHERLSIIDLKTGRQPIQGLDTAWVIHNGEIYNHDKIKKTLLADVPFRTTCDSEVIVHLYEKFGNDFCNYLDGDFAFVVIDGDKFIAGRDPIGVKPLYYGKDTEGNTYFASEMKAIVDQCVDCTAFPPGHYFTAETGLVKYYTPEYQDYTKCNEDADLEKLRDSLIESTRKRLMSDVPLGVLLSGGLDSSLISSITSRMLRGTGKKLHSFSVGLDPMVPDMIAARSVADFIGTEHHEVCFTVEQGIAAIRDIIYHIESYDVTTVRASTPMYFLSKAISEMGVKVVLSGEGADEIFGGYLYFHNAPSAEDFQKETIRRVGLLSTADCLRADKSTMAHGIEARVPFLDRNFLDVAMSINAESKQPMRAMGKPEKYILRAAFDTQEDPFLPAEILWRQKEQFSDGVGYSWIDGLVEFCNNAVSDAEFATAEARFPHNTPTTKEAFYFRNIFEELFPQESAIKSVLKWIPKWQKNTDPSGRVADVHEKRIDAKVI